MMYNYKMKLERDGETMEFEPVVTFYRDETTYGNGFSMEVENGGLGFFNTFDCRYDTRLDPEKLNEFFPTFAHDMWTGEKGSAKLLYIEELI